MNDYAVKTTHTTHHTFSHWGMIRRELAQELTRFDPLV